MRAAGACGVSDSAEVGSYLVRSGIHRVQNDGVGGTPPGTKLTVRHVAPLTPEDSISGDRDASGADSDLTVAVLAGSAADGMGSRWGLWCAAG
mmetsp:Transcript_10175/g.21419  ORF Transcript_10175/g.21419 Transcript_10175/m.21419 type:complete len:93 (+) Transcript_10175:994-1272(+)